MSHFSRIKTEIRDLEAFRAAVARMGFQIVENAECRYYHGSEKKEIVIKLPGKFDAALEKQIDGSYTLTADWWGGYVEKYLGKDGSELLKYYAVEKVALEARKQGLSVSETTEGDKVILTLRDPATGGLLVVECLPGGVTHIRAQGFAGSSCMKWFELEKALGAIEEHKKTMEFFKDDPDWTQVQIRGRYFCG